jgi:hypothetical protein
MRKSKRKTKGAAKMPVADKLSPEAQADELREWIFENSFERPVVASLFVLIGDGTVEYDPERHTVHWLKKVDRTLRKEITAWLKEGRI